MLFRSVSSHDNTDLNLIESNKLEPKELTGPILTLLQTIPINGPYELFFWSKNKHLVTSVMDIITERIDNKNKLPLFFGILDKTELMANEALLKQEIDKIINGESIFCSIFQWENRISHAAQETINSLYNLTSPKSDEKDFAQTHTSKLQDIIALIANETLGAGNADTFPSDAVNQGLLPVLSDILQNIDLPINTWKSAAPKIGQRVDSDSVTKAKLNSFYHVEITNPDFPKNHRGVFLPISTDYISVPKNLTKMCSKLGVNNLDEIKRSEFINYEKLTKDNNEHLLNDITLGFIELSAECDHAQRKTKLHRYIISALIPEELHSYCMFHNSKTTKHDGIYRAPEIYIDNKTFTLMLSFKYQIGTMDEFMVGGEKVGHKWFGNPKFRLRDQILTDISFKCSQYTSRPGIISFH